MKDVVLTNKGEKSVKKKTKQNKVWRNKKD